MNIKVIMSFFLVMLIILLLIYDVYFVRAPELFGDGHMYFARVGDRLFGYVYAWGGWMITGRVDDCRIRQLFGPQIDGVNGPIACFVDFRKNRFVGWIDFRGHRRKFCGGLDADAMPVKCYGEAHD